MLLLTLLAALETPDCLSVTVADEALGARVREELLATVGLPLGDACSTMVNIDAARLLTVTARSVSPPVVLQESLGSRLAPALATHVAEVVRGVLLEVEVRQRPPVAAVVKPQPVLPQPVIVESKRRRQFELRVGTGALISTGGLSTGLGVELHGAVRFNSVLVAGLGVLGTPLRSTRVVEQGELRAQPFAAWASFGVTLPSEGRVALTAAIVAGAWLVPLEGVANAPFIGARAVGVTPSTGLDVCVSFRLVEVVGLWAGVTTHWLFQRLALDVAGQFSTAFGPLVVFPRAGVEVLW